DLIKFINSKMIMEKPNWLFYPGAQVIMEQRLLDFVRAGKLIILSREEEIKRILEISLAKLETDGEIGSITHCHNLMKDVSYTSTERVRFVINTVRDMKLVSKEKVGTQTNGDEDNSTKRRKTSER
ncbi:unnamed protein product, partial [Didymodactylos carnosus]